MADGDGPRVDVLTLTPYSAEKKHCKPQPVSGWPGAVWFRPRDGPQLAKQDRAAGVARSTASLSAPSRQLAFKTFPTAATRQLQPPIPMATPGAHSPLAGLENQAMSWPGHYFLGG